MLFPNGGGGGFFKACFSPCKGHGGAERKVQRVPMGPSRSALEDSALPGLWSTNVPAQVRPSSSPRVWWAPVRAMGSTRAG